MRIPLISGRYFDQRDDAAGAPVIIVNRELVREYFPGQDPIGQGIQVGRDSTWRTVVGVVGDVHHNGLLGQLKRGWYLPEDQWASAWGNPRRSMTLAVRTVGDPHQIVAPVQQIVRGMDSNLPLTDVTSMANVLAAATQEQRFTMAVMSAFAALALVLAGVGIYGVISYSVNQRTREIGIRLALGARTGSVRNLVIRQGLVPALAGIGVGLGAAAMLTRFLATMLYGVAPIDALTFTAIPIALLLVAAGSVFLPALRASRIEPLEALRAE
jgi:predicted permease